MKESWSILLVEDDENAGFLLSDFLKDEHHSVTWIKDGLEAEQVVLRNTFDICVIDIMLPGLDGYSLVKSFRKHNRSVPVIFLSARSLPADKIEGFRCGGDDYLAKPYDTKELIWRIRSLIRRRYPDDPSDGKGSADDVQFHFDKQEICFGGHRISFTWKETEILNVLFGQENKTVSRKQLQLEVWKHDSYYLDNCLDVLISRIRKKISPIPGIELRTIHGKGYYLSTGSENTGNPDG